MKKIYLLAAVFLMLNKGYTQVNYSFFATTSTYTAIVGGTSPTLLATTSGGATDEGYANNLPIGFTLAYNGTNYTSIGVCTNGFAYLHATGLINSSVTYNNNLASGLGANARPIIAPLWDDIDVQSAANIKYITSGSAPNRSFTLEWSNVLWDYGAADAAISFQLKIYETSNIIEFIYKQEPGALANIGTGLGASIGITAAVNGANNFMSLSSSEANPSVSFTNETNNIVTKPATGQVYRFTPIPPCAGVPLGGTANSVASAVCANTNFNILVTGNSQGGGITYQWQSSLASQNSFTNISGAINNLLTTSQTVPRDYRCLITCTNSSQSAFSTIANLGILSGGSFCTITNDECAGAETITLGNYNENCIGVNFNTSIATQSTNTSTFFGTSQDDDIWYKFVATSDKAIIRFTNVAAFSGIAGNMAFGIYSGTTCAALTDLGGATVVINNSAGEVFYSGFTIGNTYYLRIASSNINWRATGNICVLIPRVTEGQINNCLTLTGPTISAANSNNNVWVPILDGTKLVAEINAQGNDLGVITAKVYTSSTLRNSVSSNRFYLSRNIELTPTTQPTSNVLVKLYLLNSELNQLVSQPGSMVSSLNDLFVTKNNDGCVAAYSVAGSFITPTTRENYGGNGAFVQFAIPSFSSFYMHGGLGVLPAIINDFKVEKDGMNHKLQWTTTNEINSKGFNVERSIDGINFSSIQFIQSKANNGISSGLIFYAVLDKNVLNGNNFYRLKQIDNDGKFSYSPTVVIKAGKTTNMVLNSVYPNPVKEIFTINIEAPKQDNVSIILTDLSGKILINKFKLLNMGNNILPINIASLASGVYALTITNFNGESTKTIKIIKQ